MRWKLKGPMTLIDLENNFFIVKFLLDEDMKYVLIGGPWVQVICFECGHYGYGRDNCPLNGKAKAQASEATKLESMKDVTPPDNRAVEIENMEGTRTKQVVGVTVSVDGNRDAALKDATNTNQNSLTGMKKTTHNLVPKKSFGRGSSLSQITIKRDPIARLNSDLSNDWGADKVKYASTIKDFKKVYAIDVFVVLEPRISDSKALNVATNLGFSHYHIVDATGFSRGVWIRESLWTYFDGLAKAFNLPWLVMRDFNDISCASKKCGGNFDSGGLIFVDWIDRNHLIDLGFSDSKFTWCNKRNTKGDYNLTPQLFLRLVEADLDGLSNDVSNEKIHQSLFSIGDLKSPGPNGFPAIFNQNFWDLLVPPHDLSWVFSMDLKPLLMELLQTKVSDFLDDGVWDTACLIACLPDNIVKLITDIHVGFNESGLKIPPKVKTFLWALCHKKILTNAQRHKRGFTHVEACPRCPHFMESNEHLFKDCHVIHSLWCRFGSNGPNICHYLMEFDDWLFLHLQSNKIITHDLP
ncbi:hypothetical protein DKX38_018652 [Salix brachista]|uniref:Reverse transcriptase zinc-binding domain-containing protein n=1 Tax=Salix brachista TaxID=2182728 RepID=A0A5N5KNK5_9ROSI|nr:hypothetical protein DKX38_018652 [Salix brachista]